MQETNSFVRQQGEARMKKAKKDMSPEDKKAYLKYFKEMRTAGKQPMTMVHWESSGREPVYFRGVKRTSPGARLHRSDRKAIGMKD